eukprot:SAG11_NODE_5113_length_1659_cov_2.495513_4_plen_85_part_01
MLGFGLVRVVAEPGALVFCPLLVGWGCSPPTTTSVKQLYLTLVANAALVSRCKLERAQHRCRTFNLSGLALHAHVSYVKESVRSH